MKLLKTVALVAVSSLALAAAAWAGPTQADFDACNLSAQAAISSPSASPSTGGGTGPSITTPAGTPDTTAGVTRGGGAGATGPMITGSGREPGQPGGVAEGTGALARDSGAASAAAVGSSDLLQGMAAEKANNPAYRAAYEACMKQRGF